MRNFSYLPTFFIISLLGVQLAQASVGLDRTRAVYVGDSKSISLNIANENKELPFLAQTWLEDEHFQKVTSPLVALPPLQRLEPNSKGLVRVSALADAEALPQDRESIFYFNLRGIPPKSGEANILQLALQTKIKLFYRPKKIVPDKDYIWQEKLLFSKVGHDLQIENPTPYYVTITSVSTGFHGDGGKGIGGFESHMVPPFSSHVFKLKGTVGSEFVMRYINDYGAHPELMFVCTSDSNCVADPARQPIPKG